MEFGRAGHRAKGGSGVEKGLEAVMPRDAPPNGDALTGDGPSGEDWVGPRRWVSEMQANLHRGVNQHHGRHHGEPDAVRAARRVRRPAWRNVPTAIPAPRPKPAPPKRAIGSGITAPTKDAGPSPRWGRVVPAVPAAKDRLVSPRKRSSVLVLALGRRWDIHQRRSRDLPLRGEVARIGHGGPAKITARAAVTATPLQPTGGGAATRLAIRRPLHTMPQPWVSATTRT